MRMLTVEPDAITRLKVCKLNGLQKTSFKITEGASAKSSCLKITGVATDPVGVELQALCDIDDLSLYYLGRTVAVAAVSLYDSTLVFAFPAGSKLPKGAYVTVAKDAKKFESVTTTCYFERTCRKLLF